MWLIIALTLVGSLVGFFLFSRFQTDKPLRIVGRTQQAAAVVLLFLLGVWLGGNGEFWSGISTIGLSGLLFALLAIAFSVAAVWILARLGGLGAKK